MQKIGMTWNTQVSQLVQGMMSTSFVSQLMLESFGDGWLTGGRMSLKLTNVLWVDESVSVQGKIAEEQPEGDRIRVHCEVWADKGDGTRIAFRSFDRTRFGVSEKTR